MNPIELATVDSAEELLVHLDHLPHQVTIADLAGMLCVPITAILESLAKPRNVEFSHALYEQLNAEVWKGELQDDEGLLFPLPDTTVLVQGGRGLAEHEDVVYFLSVGARFGPLDPAFWLLPQQKFIVARDEYARADFSQILTSHQGKQVCLKLFEEPVAHEALGILRGKVEALEKKLKLAAERVADHRLHVGLVQNATRMLQFLEHDQRNRGFDAEEFRENVANVREVREQFGRLEVRLLDRLNNPRDARNAALDLLGLFRTSRSEHAEFQAVVRAILERPFRVTAVVFHEFTSLLERAFSALAASPAAEDFVKEHLCALLQAVCERMPESAHYLFDDIAGTQVGDTAIHGWRTAFQDIRANLAIGTGPSLLEGLAKSGSIGKRVLSIVSAALSEGTIAVILQALIERAEGRKIGGQQFAGVMLRYLTYTAVQSKLDAQRAFLAPGASPQQVLLAGKSATLPRVKAILADDSLPAAERTKQLKALQLDKGVSRTPSTIGAMTVINTMALTVLLTDEDAPLSKKIVGTVASAGAFAQTALMAEEFFYVRRPCTGGDDLAVQRRWEVQKKLGVGVAALGLALTIMSFEELRHNKASTTRLSLAALDGVASLFGVLASIGKTLPEGGTDVLLRSSYVYFRAAAPALGVIANVLSIAVVIAVVVHDLLSRTPKKLLEAYLDKIEGNARGDFESTSFVNKNAASIIFEARKAIKRAGDDALGPFKFERGHPDNLKVFEGRLTVNKAIYLEFTKHEIASMFGVTVQVIEPHFTGPRADG